MGITEDAYNTINKYFSVLSHTGYKSYSEVNKIIILLFIEELLSGPLSRFITEKDYNIIDNILYCLYDSCIILFPNNKRSPDSIVDRVTDKHRITETNILRHTEEAKLRAKS